MSIPGVGALAALTFKAGVDVPQRFARSKSVGARRLTLLTPSCADHRIEHEEKHDPEGHSLATRRTERSELDGHRRIRPNFARDLSQVIDVGVIVRVM
jgi:hypothetical protein